MSSNYKRKYNCPYCEYRGDRESLVYHIRDEHDEDVGAGYTPARIVFNLVNKKERGTCTVCGRESQWNENNWRYDRMCSDKCREEYKKNIVDKRMINKYGKANLLGDMEHQKKMLANRKISGKYKFTDGGVKTYTGSYEKSLLEFMDKVMGIASKDIETPGPIIEYPHEGKLNYWITDLLYIPFNLVFDVKDGGTNKNTHPGMSSNRSKQNSKESSITKLGSYNYVRLTDNDFSQLISIMAEIKKSMMENVEGSVIRINECMIGTMSSIEEPTTYIIPYSSNDIGIEGVGFTRNLLMDNIFVSDEYGEMQSVNKDFFKDKYYGIIKTIKPKDFELLKENSEDYNIGKLYENGISCYNDILISSKSDVIHRGYDLTKFDIIKEIQEIASFQDLKIKIALNENVLTYECDVYLQEGRFLLDGNPHLVLKENHLGYFIKNKDTGRRSKYYKSLNEVPRYILSLI